jgi:LacI family transcriptional regulator
MQYPTIEDIARKVGKSVATVSRVLNGKENQDIPISAKTRDLILMTADELNYRPNYLARNLVQGDSRVIGFVVPDIMQSYFNEICHHLSRRLGELGYDIVLAHSYENPASERHSVEMLLSRRVSGIIISPAMGRENLPFLLEVRKTIPMILLDRYFPGSDFSAVTTDDTGGCDALTGHLIGRGAARILFVAGNRETSVTAERVEGYRRALERHAIPFDESLVIESGYFMEDGYAAAVRLLGEGAVASADAVMGVNDAVALGVLRALDEAGIAVPGRMLVAGYSNDRYSEYFRVPLTTVRQPKEVLAGGAVDLLMELIKEGKTRHLRVPCELVVRESTAGGGEARHG